MESKENPTEQTTIGKQLANNGISMEQTYHFDEVVSNETATEPTGLINGKRDFHDMESKECQNTENMKIVLDVFIQNFVEDEILLKVLTQHSETIIPSSKVKEIYEQVDIPEQMGQQLFDCLLLEMVRTVIIRRFVEKEHFWPMKPGANEMNILRAATRFLEYLKTKAYDAKDFFTKLNVNDNKMSIEFPEEKQKENSAKMTWVSAMKCANDLDSKMHVYWDNGAIHVSFVNQENEVLQSVQRIVNVIDPLSSEASQRVCKVFYLELMKHGIRAIETDADKFNADTSPTDVAMVICYHGSRLESNATNVLSKFQEEKYKKILLVILHNKNLEKLPPTSSKELLCDNPKFHSLYDIVDIAYRDGNIYECDFNEKAFKSINMISCRNPRGYNQQ